MDYSYEKVKLHQLGSDEPACPRCHGHNAMLHCTFRYTWAGEDRWANGVICRDCGLMLTPDGVEVIHYDKHEDYVHALIS